MIPVQQLGWIAGVIDLKGRIVVKNNKRWNSQQICLSVQSKNFDIIRRLSSYTGTSPNLQAQKDAPDFMRRGCNEHCPEKHVHIDMAWKLPAMANWTISGAGAAIVLLNIMPYIVDYKNFPETIQEIFKNTPLHTSNKGANAVIRQIKRLHALGWEIPEQFESVLSIQEIIEAELDREGNE